MKKIEPLRLIGLCAAVEIVLVIYAIARWLPTFYASQKELATFVDAIAILRLSLMTTTAILGLFSTPDTKQERLITQELSKLESMALMLLLWPLPAMILDLGTFLRGYYSTESRRTRTQRAPIEREIKSIESSVINRQRKAETAIKAALDVVLRDVSRLRLLRPSSSDLGQLNSAAINGLIAKLEAHQQNLEKDQAECQKILQDTTKRVAELKEEYEKHSVLTAIRDGHASLKRIELECPFLDQLMVELRETADEANKRLEALSNSSRLSANEGLRAVEELDEHLNA